MLEVVELWRRVQTDLYDFEVPRRVVNELGGGDLPRDGLLQVGVDGHVQLDAGEQVRDETQKQRLVLVHLTIDYCCF